MSGLWHKFKSAWTHIAWLVAFIVIMIDPDKVYEWAHQHEVWGGVMAAIFMVVLAWAQKSQTSSSVIAALRERERLEQKGKPH